jgi:rod shape-determining protein MreC
MNRLNEWVINRRDLFTLLAAILFSIGLLLSNDGLQIQTIQSWTLDGFGFFLEKVSFLSEVNAVREENEVLRRNNTELLLSNSRLKEALAENLRLRELLDFKETSRLELIPAKVIGKANNGFINSIVLASGSADSIHKNMAVVTAQGLVGKIFSVSERHATTQVLLDRNFRVSAMVQRSRVNGIIKWHEGSRVILAEVPKRSDVAAGDTVVTSGLSFIFPGGLLIGKVLSCVENEPSMFMEIVVEPAVDFSRLEEVFVIRSQPTSPRS